MNIQWFPGHMTKTLRAMQDDIKNVDCVIYLLDARAISASFNREFDSIIQNKPVLYLINKSDLIDKKDLEDWKKRLKVENKDFVVTIGTNCNNSKEIVEKLKWVNRDKIERYKAKGVNKIIRAMVIGIPNSGKSTIINSLCKDKKTKTGNKAGVTRGKQWVRLSDNLELLDTPGTLCPKFENQKTALHTVLIGSINDVICDMQEVALELLKFYLDRCKKEFADYYKISEEQMEQCKETPLQLMEIIGKVRGHLVKGGAIDYERVSKALIDDYRNGKLGKIILEKADEEY